MIIRNSLSARLERLKGAARARPDINTAMAPLVQEQMSTWMDQTASFEARAAVLTYLEEEFAERVLPELRYLPEGPPVWTPCP
jgi:hypothetical protein